MKRRSTRYLLLVVLAILVVSMVGTAREENPPEEPQVVPIGRNDSLWEMDELVPGEPGGEVQYSTDSFPNTFNNLLGKNKETKDVTKMIMGSGLTAVNPVNGRIVPAFAKSWSVSDDGRVYTFNLREGLKFSDGQPLTAEDVVFTYEELIFNPEVNSERIDIIRLEGELPELEVIDTSTVKFKLPEPHGPFLREVSTGIYPKHKLAGITGEEFNKIWNKETAAENPKEIVGAGPFQLKEFSPGEEIILTRNPHYYKVDSQGTQLPYLDRYRVVRVKDNIVEFLNFRSGKTDFLRPQIRDMPYLLSHAAQEDWNLLTGEGNRSAPLNSNFLTFNWNTERKDLNELFRKSDFRRAVSLAIDTEDIVEEVFNGFGQPQYGPISRLSPYHKSNLKNMLSDKYNPEAAREILAELGINDSDEDEVREMNSGKPVRFSILVNNENLVRTEMAEIIARGLKNIGLKVEVESFEFEDYSSRLINGNFQSAISSALVNPREPATLFDIFTSGGPLHLWNLGPDRTLTEWEKEINQLFRNGLKANGFQERKKYYDRFQELFAEKLPVIYLPGERFIYATGSSVRNWEEFNRLGTFLDFAEFIWVEE
ncbi:ABC transporter substrate-binding protein [Candidatus Bipolaricaulota bacterium]|nr:ABC transporter substrate-binding protein [Candidatus Bipolaricaulota bacterium]